MSSSGLNLEKFLIPLDEINRATQNFSSETQIGRGEHGKVYRGQLSERWQNRHAAFKRCDPESDQGNDQFLNELEFLSSFHHKNIISLIGYCDEYNEKIVVTEHAINGSLGDHLEDPNKRQSLTWAQRLKICLDAAEGLEYLHSGLGERGRVIKRELNSGNILLDENWEAKLCDFGFSRTIPRNQPYVYAPAAGTRGYMDPLYLESNILLAETDIYAFGVVLFEVLCGKLAHNRFTFEDGKPQRLIQSIRRSYDVGMERLIDPFIRDQMDRSSFNMVKEIAYKCVSFNINNRPRLDVIVKTMERALVMHKREATSSVVVRSLQSQKPDFFRSPLKEIKLDTSSKTPMITDDGSRNVYRGKFSERCQNHEAAIKNHDRKSSQGKEFLNELKLISGFNHENIIPFIGYCDQGNEKIIVTEHAINGSLDYHLKDPIKRGLLTWAHRLKICLGVARGLKYLHSGLGERGKVVQGEPSSRNILLDENMEAKLCDFGHSVLIPRNQPHFYECPVGIRGYVDPASQESRFPKTEVDVYTFGVVMFELLTGMLASELENLKDVNGQRLINQKQRCYDDELDMLVDPLIKDQVDCQSLHAFIDLAYECISLETRERPSINMIIRRIQELMDFQNRTITTIQSHQKQKLEDFLIPLEEIKRAIGGDFSSKNQTGDGGFGVVYKGQLSEHWKNRTVAIKRLKPSDYDGNKEFLNEIKLIFRFQHENIIPFIGYCDEGGEMIIVTEYASNGSLDCYLEDAEKRGSLTWTQRLKMCLGTARGLNHLHSAHGKGNTVIHRDIKSANILLDDNLEAKICDFGLSRLHLKTHLDTDTGVYTKQAGTMFYMDPTYQESGKLRTQSDVYSFGVVMFEMLSGMLAHHHKDFGNGRQQLLIGLVRRYYAAGGLDWLMDPLIRDQPYDTRSFHTFVNMAYECINMNYEERPTMEIVIERIEEALGYQASLPPPF